MTAADFDSLARFYRGLERLAFGRALERARFAHVARLAECRNILLIGDGDGRFLERALIEAPMARVRSIDASAAMLRIAASRVAPGDRARVTFDCADVRALTWPSAEYDAVATMFVLDCFTDAEARAVVANIGAATTPGAVWLFADFAIPDRGWKRLIGRAVTAALYTFFRWRTGISATQLPESEDHIAHAGFWLQDSQVSVFGLLRSVVFAREIK
ncbi:MAG: class I SAM-dependent methyltransferase [Acidobacteria bacterium]|nr:MAG: class I SAM-dependent methyltransferase [Acidobacteriota bacterium]